MGRQSVTRPDAAAAGTLAFAALIAATFVHAQTRCR
jgi:hypothetical protein